MFVMWEDLRPGMVVQGYTERYVIYFEYEAPKDVLRLADLPKPLLVIAAGTHGKKKAVAFLRSDGFRFWVGTGDADQPDWLVIS